MRLTDIIATKEYVDAGGPGSGRKPGFGARPANVPRSHHQMLVNKGYKPTGRAWGGGGFGAHTTEYSHPSGAKAAVDSDSKWRTYGNKDNPRQLGHLFEKTGTSSYGLEKALNEKHGN